MVQLNQELRIKKLKKIFIFLASTVLLASCESGAMKEQETTRELLNKAAVEVGMPAIKRFTEKRQLKMLYELRDDPNLVTYTYTQDMTGHRHKVCNTTSIGFGIPYGTQYSDTGLREPNMLFPPSSADATWVMCLSKDGKNILPAYIEDRIQVYQEPMPNVDEGGQTQ